MLSLLCVLSVFAAGITAAGAATAQQARAAAAADLAALSAADALERHGSSDQACSAARRLAAINGAEIESCDIRGDEVLVTVVAHGVAAFGFRSRATARAGPAP